MFDIPLNVLTNRYPDMEWVVSPLIGWLYIIGNVLLKFGLDSENLSNASS